MVKNHPTMKDTQVQSLGWEDSLEKGIATHPLQCSCLENPMDREAWQLQSMGLQRVGHYRATNWRRQWHPTPVLLPGKPHGRRSLVGCSPWGREESDMTEQLHFHFSLSCLEKEMATHSSTLAWRIPGTGEPGESQGRGSLVGCRLWGRTESDTSEAT